MTAPIWSLEARARSDQSIADSEWQKYQDVHKQLMDALMNEIKGYADQTGLTPLNAQEQALTDPTSMQPAPPPTAPGQVDRGRQDLIERANFWHIPNPEQLSTDQLQQQIMQRRAGQKPEAPGSLEAFGTAVEGYAAEAGSVMTKLLGNLTGQVGGGLEMIPFGGKFLSDMLNTERARTWLYKLSSTADEAAQASLALQPPENRTATQYLLGAGKMTGYALPAIAAWEGLGALGASLPTTPWLARAATPFARSAVKGALSALVLQDPDEPLKQQAFNIGLGAILGGANMWGRVGAAAGLGALGAGLGGEVGDTPEARRRHAIEWGLGGAALPFLAPMLGKAFTKVAGDIRSALDGSIPVDQTQRPPAPGEEVVIPESIQISGNPPPPRIGPGGGGGLPATPDEILRSEPTRTLENIQGPAGLIPHSTETPPGAAYQQAAADAYRAIAGTQAGPGEVAFPYAFDQFQRRADLETYLAQRYAPQTAPGTAPPEFGPTGGLPAPRVAGLLPATNTSTRLFDVEHPRSFEDLIAGQNDYVGLVRQALSDESTAANVLYNYTSGHDSVQSLQYALDVARGVLDYPRAYAQVVVDRAAELASTLPPRIASLDFNAQRYAPLEHKGLASVTQGPDKLLGSKVADAQGNPMRVYHGTPAVFQEFDLSKADPEALYDGGLYHTEDPGVASGYPGAIKIRYELKSGLSQADIASRFEALKAQRDAGQQVNQIALDVGYSYGRVVPVTPTTNFELIATRPEFSDMFNAVPETAPNVRPAWLDIKNPFNIDAQFSPAEVESLISRLETLHPEWSFRDSLNEVMDYTGRLQSGEPMDGNAIYSVLEGTASKEMIQGPQPEWLQQYDEFARLGKAGTNQMLRELGYDGITHIGGRLVGDHDHRVWIAFDPSQVHAPWSGAPLNQSGAADAAAAITKQATVMEGSTLGEAVAKPQVTDSDVVTAMKATNPGGTSVLHDVGDALQVMSDHPDVNFVQRGNQIDALIGEFTPEMVQDYKAFGMYSGQEVVTARGIEGEILHISGKGFATIARKGGGPPLRVKVENLLPGRFGDPQRNAPDLWNQFKASLLRYTNEESGRAGMAPVDSIWDLRAQESMQQHLQDFMDARGINDPRDRQALDIYMNERFVQEAKDLDPEARDLQARLGMSDAVASNEREVSDEPIPVSLEEKAQSKGFIWLTEPGSGGGTLKDTLNPEGGLEVPIENEAAAEEFLNGVNRTPPDLNPAADAPAEAMETASADGNLEPRWGVEEESDAIAEHVNSFGGGGGEPPATPPGVGPAMGPDGWARIPGNAEKLGAQFARLRRDNPAKLDELRRIFKNNAFRYTRYLMQKVEDQLTQAGVDMGRAWFHYDALETARTKADYEARPWLDEYGGIMREFTSKILRKGDVTRIHEIEDPNARYAEWYRLKDKYGYTDKEIKRFIAADEKLADFNHRWFQYLIDDPNYGLTAEREIFRYMSHVRARQAAGAPGDVYDHQGFLSPYTEYFAEFAREGNLQFRVMDARELGNYMVRAGMFKKWQSGPWQDLVSAWQDPRVPSEFQDLMLGHAKLMKFGYDGRGDLLVNATRWMITNVMRVPVTTREAADILNIPVSGMYRALLGGRTSIFFRDAIQPMLALSKVRTDVMAGVYRDVLAGSGDHSFAAMRQRGLEGGWITPDAPAMEAAGVFEAPAGLRQDELLHLTPAQAARRERLAEFGDLFRDAHRLRAIDRATNTLHLYGKEQGINRMIVGEAAFRQAQTAIAEFRASQLTAILNRDPSMAMDYQQFADNSFFSSFSRPIQRALKELIDADKDKEAAQLFARQVADFSQFKYGRREQPAIVRSQFGRLAYTFGNFTGQFAEAVGSILTSGSANPVARARQIARGAMVIGGVSYALHELEQRTGWGFSKWAWPNSFKFVGSPAAGAVANLYQAAGGAVALSEGRTPSLSQAGALQEIQTGHPFAQTALNVFPYTGYARTASQLASAAQGIAPIEQTARYLVTGDRGTRGLVFPPGFFDQQAEDLKRAIMQADSARASHPGSGAIP